MKKREILAFAKYFGASVPAGKIQNRETRMAIVMLYSSLVAPTKAIEAETEAVRKSLVEGHEDEIMKYAALRVKAGDTNLSEEERNAAKAEADAMTECISIDADYSEAMNRILSEECDAPIKKVSLDVLYDALCDCGFPLFKPEMTLAEVRTAFEQVIAE